MSYFKNFTKTISASRLTKPNNLILIGISTNPVLLSNSPEPCVDHINTLKALHSTVSLLTSHAQGPHASLVATELAELTPALRTYATSCVYYVEHGGHLTAQGAANLYACASELGVNANWLKTHVRPHIPSLVRNMNVENLRDVSEGLSKYHGSCEFIKLVEAELSNRSQEPVEYVTRAVNELGQFEEASERSGNILLDVIESNKSSVHYYARKSIQMTHDWFNAYTKRPYGYVLHN